MGASATQGEPGKSGAAATETTRGDRLAARKAAKAAQKAADKGRVPLAQSKFNQAMAAGQEWANRNRRPLSIAVCSTALVVGIFSAWKLYASSIASGAGSLLKKAVATSLAPIQTNEEPGEEEPPKAKPEAETYSSQEARANSALKAFGAVGAKYPNSAAAAWARIGEGNALMELGKYAQARKFYTKALSAADDDVFLKYRALEGLAMTLEDEKQYAEASKRFEELAKLADGAYKPTADYHSARILLAQGKQDQAVKLLGQILANLEKMTPEQRARFEFVKAEATADLLGLGYDPDLIRSSVGAVTRLATGTAGAVVGKGQSEKQTPGPASSPGSVKK